MTATQAPPSPATPGTVFAASYLFAGVAALALVTAIGAFFAIPEFSNYHSERAVDGAAGRLATFGLVAFALMAIVFGAVCLLLAVLGGRGMNQARGLTWTVGGLAAVANLVILAVGDYHPVRWFGVLTDTTAIGTLLLTAVTVTLLALPASRAYFRATRLARLHRGPRVAPTTPAGFPVPPAGFPVPPPGYPVAMPGHPVPAPNQPVSAPAYPVPVPYQPVSAPGYPLPPPGYRPLPSPPLQRTRRPFAVTTAMVVLLGTAVLSLGAAAVEILTYRAALDWLDTYKRTLQEQVAPSGIQVAFPELPDAAVGPTVLIVGALVFIAAILVGLAAAIRLPRLWARIIALVVVGLLAPLAAGRAILTASTQATLRQLDNNSRRLYESMGVPYPSLSTPPLSEIYPPWVYYGVYLISALVIVGCVVVFILLMLPNSGAWFTGTPARTGWPVASALPFVAAPHPHQSAFTPPDVPGQRPDQRPPD